MAQVLGAFGLLGFTTLGRGYTGARTNTTQQSGETPDNEVYINNIIVFVRGCTETDPTGLLSPSNFLFSVCLLKVL
jgi:hypothetical protein